MAARRLAVLGEGWRTQAARRRATICNLREAECNPVQQIASRGSPQVAASQTVMPQSFKIVLHLKLFYAEDEFPRPEYMFRAI